MYGRGRAARPGMFSEYAAWSALEIELQALVTFATLAQISTPSAAHFLKSHQLLVRRIEIGNTTFNRTNDDAGLHTKTPRASL
jgi:hypothetical protein